MIFDKIYMVKNMSTNDELSSEVVILPHPLDNSKLMSSLSIPPLGITAGEYKCVQVAEEFSFDGTENWAQLMEYQDYVHNQYNPIFFDLTPVPYAEIGETLEELGAGPSNEQLVSSIIRETSVGPLFKSAAWSDLDKIAFNDYWHRVWDYCGLGNVGALMAMMMNDKAVLAGGGTVTVVSRGGPVMNVNTLTESMLDYAIAKCVVYKRKFPDGTV